MAAGREQGIPMAKDVFRHPYEELRQITELPLAEARWLGDGEPLRRLVALMEASDLVRVVAEGPCAPDTRLLVTNADPARLEDRLRQGPLPRTCVVLDLSDGLWAAALPLPLSLPLSLPLAGMCLQATLVAEGAVLRARLLPRASTVPEALELVAELLHALGVEIEQRPVDEAPR
jgi:hypothetical protein